MKIGTVADRDAKISATFERVGRARFVFAVILLAAAGAACQEMLISTEPSGQTPTRLVLSPESATIARNDSVSFVAIGFTASGDTADIQVLWSASSGNINSKGKKGGRHTGWYRNGKCGDYQVTATSVPGEISASAKVKVVCAEPGPVASVTVTPASVTLQVGQSVQLSAELKDANGLLLSGRTIEWASSNSGVAGVDGDGLVTSSSEGSATITATSEGVSGTASITVTAVSGGGGNTAPNLKVAFIGDQGLGSDAVAVLQLIKDEGANMVLHQGDFDYRDDPTRWDDQITSVLGADFPYFASVGNHDEAAFYGAGGYQEKLTQRLSRVSGATCTGEMAVNSTCEYQGLFFILSGVGTLGSGHEDYIRQQLAADNSTWRICSWHKNQHEMQVGGKGNSVGWGPYEACRELGAIIATAHEHSYHRTKTLVSTEQQTVDPDWPDPGVLRVTPGATFVFVSGIAGASIRDQERCLPDTYPYGCKGEWASIYTSNQNAQYGALFIEFHVDGDPNKARGYFRDIDGAVVDQFTVTSQ